jgi:hypothetical protein
MAENIPNMPGGAVPPKKETGKVQPKKETVRINLPPKPSAAPTIKLPTLPPGGAVGAPSAAAAAPVAATAAPAAAPAPHNPPPPKPPTGAPGAMLSNKPGPAPTSSGRTVPGGSAPGKKPKAPSTIGTLDNALAIAAAVAALAAVGTTCYLIYVVMGPNTIQ